MWWIDVLLLLVVAALFALHHSCDFLLQAHQPGWIRKKTVSGSSGPLNSWWHTWLPTAFKPDGIEWTRFLNRRSKKWPWYADWIPHDPWHIVQTVRNNSIWLGTILLAQIITGGSFHDWWPVYIGTGTVYAFYRAGFFTKPMWDAEKKRKEMDA